MVEIYSNRSKLTWDEQFRRMKQGVVFMLVPKSRYVSSVDTVAFTDRGERVEQKYDAFRQIVCDCYSPTTEGNVDLDSKQTVAVIVENIGLAGRREDDYLVLAMHAKLEECFAARESGGQKFLVINLNTKEMVIHGG